MMHLADKPNYVIRLGSHRIVMLDSGHDTELPENKLDLILYALGGLSEGKRTAVGGSPNSLGVTDKMIKLVTDALNETPDDGLFIVGLHAPLFNLWKEEYPYFLRETQRGSQSNQVHGWIARHDIYSQAPDPGAKARERHPLWFASTGDPNAVTYVKRGDPSDLLDYGVSRGGSYDILKAVAGVGQRRRGDLVLHGHIHRYNEFRIDPANGELALHMDFYTQNLPRYYPTRYLTGWKLNQLKLEPKSDVTHVEVAEGAPANGLPTEIPVTANYRYVVQVPPYPKPLATAADPRAWWMEHRPLVLQTEALGPFKDGDANLAGYRVISVKNDVIERIHSLSIEKLHAANYRIDWEQIIKPDAPRPYVHLQRSNEFGGPLAASGRPCMFSLPPGQTPDQTNQTIVYRDVENRLFEIWRDGAGKRGAGNLTGAGGAPPAIGSPSRYIDATAGLVVVPYQGADRQVHSLYWGIGWGGTGHDALSGSVRAPETMGRPVGYHNPATNMHLVTYRGANGHLHALSWQGQGAVLHEDLVGGANAIAAKGDPAAYLDTKRWVNIVVYRAVDDCIRSIYWSNGPSGMDDLSGYAHTPHAAGDPAACYVLRHDAHYVVYRAANGHLYLLQWFGVAPVFGMDLTTVAGAPVAAGDPYIWDNPSYDRHHVIYRGSDGHVYDINWAPNATPRHLDLCAAALSPLAADEPFGLDGPTHQHVVYRGKDNHIHEIRWTEEPVDITGWWPVRPPRPPVRPPR
jgi:hypothetical protein